jgi:hypothetical protein
MAIYEDLVTTLRTEEIRHPSVARYLREAKFATSNPEATYSGLIHQPDDCNQAILLALEEQPFLSRRQLARLTHPPRTAVHRRSTRSLGPQVRYRRRVPH